jgi:hypothetical protein
LLSALDLQKLVDRSLDVAAVYLKHRDNDILVHLLKHPAQHPD